MSKRSASILILTVAAAISQAALIANNQPVPGGGISRWSKLWIDPTGENDLDGDAICYTDFTTSQQVSINHIEWWGTGDRELGFQVEIWKQDPDTIAYQPYAVFRESGALPLTAFITSAYSVTPGPGGIEHFQLDLANPIIVPANNAQNPRWFLAVIGRTARAYYQWNWSQSTGSNHTFQWIRGGNEGGGDSYRSLGDGRAMVLAYLSSISGSVTLQEFQPGPNGQTVDIELLNGDVVQESKTLTLGVSGGFSFRTAVGGRTTIRVKASHWLAKVAGPYDLNGDVTGVNVSLINGDIVPDNEVSLPDYSELARAYGSVPGDSNWNREADLNGDEEVSLGDYGILARNFGQTGD